MLAFEVHFGRALPVYCRTNSPLSGSALPRESLCDTLASRLPDTQNARAVASPEDKALRLIYETHARCLPSGITTLGSARLCVCDGLTRRKSTELPAFDPSRPLRCRLPPQDAVVAVLAVLVHPALPVDLCLLLARLVGVVVEALGVMSPLPLAGIGLSLKEHQPGSHGVRHLVEPPGDGLVSSPPSFAAPTRERRLSSGQGTEPRPPFRLRRIIVAAESVGHAAHPPLAVTVCPLALRYATQSPEWGVRSIHIAFLPASLSGSRGRERGMALRAVGRYPS